MAEDLVGLSVAELLQLPLIGTHVLRALFSTIAFGAFGLRHQHLPEVGRVPFIFFGITGDWKFHKQVFLLPQTYSVFFTRSLFLKSLVAVSLSD